MAGRASFTSFPKIIGKGLLRTGLSFLDDSFGVVRPCPAGSSPEPSLSQEVELSSCRLGPSFSLEAVKEMESK